MQLDIDVDALVEEWVEFFRELDERCWPVLVWIKACRGAGQGDACRERPVVDSLVLEGPRASEYVTLVIKRHFGTRR